ncbi:MAG: 4Fe-4S binding protein [Candidatus Omnitrophica bacterium]|nr:4Fe-4S binding protein [Candidatus Omnitrophota bacterium]
MRKLVILRRLSQACFLALFIYILWPTTYPLQGILPADTFFKINPFVMIFTSISGRVILPGIIFSLIMLALTLIVGRFFCGWVCPLGTIIDACGAISKRKTKLTQSKNKTLRSIKFYILAVIAIFSFIGIQIAWVFDPIVITARFVSLNLIPAVTLGFDKVFIFFIRQFNFYGPLYDFYRALKSLFLGVNVYYFSHSGIIFIFFLLIACSTLLAKRFWCRAICPLGAMYSLVARISFLRRIIEECAGCLKCKTNCRMAAINDDLSYQKGECILCMDCIYDCPTHKTRFAWSLPVPPRRCNNASQPLHLRGGTTRREFIFLMLASFLSLGLGFGKKAAVSKVIRPPGVLKEQEFLDRCIRCGNCMKVCITNGLQPSIFECGLDGIWTPRLVPEIGYCEYQCTLCGNVCPTGAIPRLSLEEKKKTRLGVAEVDRSICLVWAHNKECLVCEEHCPVSDKAIKLTEGFKPYVDPRLCVGCGICQNKCPVRPQRAIKVSPFST